MWNKHKMLKIKIKIKFKLVKKNKIQMRQNDTHIAGYVKNKTLWIMEKMLITIIFSFTPECAIPFKRLLLG